MTLFFRQDSQNRSVASHQRPVNISWKIDESQWNRESLMKRLGVSMPSQGQIWQHVKGKPCCQKTVCHCMSNIISRVQRSTSPNNFPTYSVTSEIPFKRDHSIRWFLKFTEMHILHGEGAVTHGSGWSTWWIGNKHWWWCREESSSSECLLTSLHLLPSFLCSLLSQQRGWFGREWPRAELIFTPISCGVLWETRARFSSVTS